MNYRKAAICLTLLLFGLNLPCSNIRAENYEENPITFEDATGASITIEMPVTRIVALNSDTLEVICALGAEDCVVGINAFVGNDHFWNEKVRSKAIVGCWNEPDYEMIASLHPDVVICYGYRPSHDLEKKLKLFDIAVVRLDFYKISTLEREITVLGRILQRKQKAARLASWYRNTLIYIRNQLQDCALQPDVYIESYADYHTAGPGSSGSEMCRLAGGRNIAGEFSIPYAEITSEWVLSKNPDVIVKAANIPNTYLRKNIAPLLDIRNRIVARPAWNHIRAAQNEKVYVLANEIWTGPRAIIGIAYMAKWFFPDHFLDFNPEKLHREYYDTFQGVSYQGHFAYPEIKGKQ